MSINRPPASQPCDGMMIRKDQITPCIEAASVKLKVLKEYYKDECYRTKIVYINACRACWIKAIDGGKLDIIEVTPL